MSWDIQSILAFLGTVVLIGNAAAVIHRWIKPVLNVKEEVDNNTEDIKDLQEQVKHTLVLLEKTIETNNKLNKAEIRCMIDILNHMITGNHQEEMIKTRDRTVDLLTEMEP